MIEGLEADYEDTGKSPSQRLRSVFFVLWKTKTDGYSTFDDYYRHMMEMVIEHFKKKIDE